MKLRREIWSAFMLYTSTQLLLASSVLLVLLTVPFGVIFSGTVVLCYILSCLVWDLNVKDWVKNLTWPQFYRTVRPRNYSGVVHEVELIKRSISRSFIQSWTTDLELDEGTKAKLCETALTAVDRLLSLVSTRQFNIFDFITDLIHGAHLHIICYNKAKVDPMPRKSGNKESKFPINTRFLSSSHTDWTEVHSVHQSAYFRAVTAQILCKYLKVEELSPLSLEALATIIADNVLAELARYLTQQPNLLKLIIRVLSDDFVELLRTAEVEAPSPTEECSGPREEPVLFTLDSLEEEEVNEAHDVYESAESSDNAETTPNVASGNEYVSDELMKYLKVVPSSDFDKPKSVACPKSGDVVKPSVVPAVMMMMPALAYATPAATDASMTALTATFVHQSDASMDKSRRAKQDSSLDGQSVDSGLSLTPNSKLLVKFRDVGIPEAVTRVERHGAKYTLYAISYHGVYRHDDDDLTFTKECKVFRRFREFGNLRARLEKSPQYQKVLKSIPGPSWWHHVSLNARKAQEVEKRRASLERFIRALVCHQVIHVSKDLEEFLAYNGGAEIEFVQEKIEIIPEAVRLDRVVMRKVSGVFDKVTDKLSSQSHYTPTDAAEYKKSKLEFIEAVTENPPVFSVSDRLQSDLLSLLEEDELGNLITAEFKTKPEPKGQAMFRRGEKRASRRLADGLFQILLLLLQDHLDCSKNKGVVSAVSSFLVPYLTHWLRNKVNIYSAPQKLSKLLALFRETLWPEEEEKVKRYDLEVLKQLAIQCVMDEIPAPVTVLMSEEIRKLIDDVLEMTDNSDINEQLCYTLVAQLLSSSLSMLLPQ